MNKLEKPRFPKGLIIYLIIVPIFLLFMFYCNNIWKHNQLGTILFIDFIARRNTFTNLLMYLHYPLE